MLASFPASMLNQNRSDLGILNRFNLTASRSSSRDPILYCLETWRNRYPSAVLTISYRIQRAEASAFGHVRCVKLSSTFRTRYP
jgi:hypothetical protein